MFKNVLFIILIIFSIQCYATTIRWWNCTDRRISTQTTDRQNKLQTFLIAKNSYKDVKLESSLQCFAAVALLDNETSPPTDQYRGFGGFSSCDVAGDTSQDRTIYVNDYGRMGNRRYKLTSQVDVRSLGELTGSELCQSPSIRYIIKARS